VNLIEYPDREMLAINLADKLASQLRASLDSHDRVTLAVPGGTSPGPVFDALCGVRLDWERVDVMLTVERWVPEDHERSNTRLLRQRLLTDAASSAHLVPLYTEARAPEDVLAEIELDIVPRLPLNVVLLGMGADMHTASIFPGADRLADALAADAPVLMPMRAPGAPEPRITITAHVLNGALAKHLLIFGAEKREALDRALTLSPQEAPIAAVLDDMTVHWAE
jgi:6-phosphogluconolactonase